MRYISTQPSWLLLGFYLGVDMKKLLLASFATLAVLSGSALAADMPARPTYKSAPMPAPVYNWTGCYVDGGFGYALYTITRLFGGTGPRYGLSDLSLDLNRRLMLTSVRDRPMEEEMQKWRRWELAMVTMYVDGWTHAMVQQCGIQLETARVGLDFTENGVSFTIEDGVQFIAEDSLARESLSDLYSAIPDLSRSNSWIRHPTPTRYTHWALPIG
jgi:hypothetical protein